MPANSDVDLFELAGIATHDQRSGSQDGVDLFKLAGMEETPRTQSPSGASAAAADFGKLIGSSAVRGIADIPLGVEQGVKGALRQGLKDGGGSPIPALRLPSIIQQTVMRDSVSERGAAADRLVGALPDVPGTQALSDAGHNWYERVASTVSDETKQAMENSRVTGNLLKGEIDFGKDPSVRGYVMQAADVFGSLIPVVVSTMVTKRPMTGAAVGGGMAASEGARDALEFIGEKSHEDLLQDSPFYARLIQNGVAPEEAKRQTLDKAMSSAAFVQGLIGGAGDRVTSGLVLGQFDKALQALSKSRAGRAAIGGVGTGLQGGVQETAESIGADLAIRGVDRTKDVGEDSASDFVLGMIGESPVGAGRGLISRSPGATPEAETPQDGASPEAQSNPVDPDRVDINVTVPPDAVATPAQGEGGAPEAASGQSAQPAEFSYDDYTSYRRTLESGGQADARNPASSATGIDQFTSRTWLDLVRRHQPAWAEGLSEQQILAQRTDPDISGEMVELLDQENAQALSRAGQPISNENLYAAHHFGADRGVAFARADGNTPMSEILSPEQMKANAYLQGLTKDDAIANWSDRAAGRTPTTGRSAQDAQAEGQVQDEIRDAAQDEANTAAPVEAEQEVSERADLAPESVEEALQAPEQQQEASQESAPEVPRTFPEFVRQQGLRPSEMNGEQREALRAQWQAAMRAPQIPQAPQPVLQNRNRATQESQAQMRRIAQNPKFALMSGTNRLYEGTPVLENVGIPQVQLGASVGIVDADGGTIPGRFAVVDTGAVVTSHDINGNRNPAFETGGGQPRVLAGNGRMAGLDAGYQQGNAVQYRHDMQEALQSSGIDPVVAQGMARPALVRVIDPQHITPDMADRTNRAGMASLSPAEQAATDAGRLDLSRLSFTDSGKLSQQAVGQFVQGMPASERSGLTSNGRPTPAATTRLENAIFQEAYGDLELLELFANTDQAGIKRVMSAMLQAAPHMARLKGAGVYDIRSIVADAAKELVNAARSDLQPAEFAAQRDIMRSFESQAVVDMMVRDLSSAKRMGEQLTRLAQSALAESNRDTEPDLTGEVPPRRTTGQIFREILNADDATSQADLRQQRRPATAEGLDGGQEPGQPEGSGGREPAAARAERAGRPEPAGRAQGQGAQAATERTDQGSDRSDGQERLDEVAPTDFIPAPNGSLDYGEITPEMGKAMGRQAGKIRLEVGDESYGARHIEQRHGDDIRASGFPSVEAFVRDIASNIEQVWRPATTAQVVAVHRAGNDRIMYVELRLARDDAGDYYTVRTAFPARRGYINNKGWKLLWEGRAQPPVDSGKSTPFAAQPSVKPGKTGAIPSDSNPPLSRDPVPADASGASGFVDQSPDAGGTAPMVEPQGGNVSVAQNSPDVTLARRWDGLSEQERAAIAKGVPNWLTEKGNLNAAGRRATKMSWGRLSEAQRGRLETAAQSDALELTGQTEAEAQADAEASKQAEAAEQRQKKEAEQRAQADAERGEFTLTGSDRAADVGAAHGQGDLLGASGDNTSANEPAAPYTTDLFGDPVPAPKRKAGSARSQGAGVRRNVQPAAQVQGDTQAPDGDYFARTKVGVTQQRQMGASHVRSFADLAAATSYLYRSAVERFDAVVTDKDGKILAVVGGFKGALSQASVYPGIVVAEAVRVPGAANIWFSHNHPSGKPNLSRADEALNEALADVFRGSGIEPRGLIAVGNGQFSATDGSLMGVPQRASKSTVPVVERELADSSGPLIPLTSATTAKVRAKELYDAAKQPGIILLNSQHEMLAWVPVPDAMLGKLRDTGQLRALYRAISEANAGAAILVHGGELDARVGTVTASQNIAQALNNIDVRPLDSITIAGGRTTSAAEQAIGIARGPVFSRRVGQPRNDANTKIAKWRESLREAFASAQAKEPSMATPAAIRHMGAKSNRLELPRRYLQAIARKHQDVPASVIENLPSLLDDPLFIISHKGGGLRVFVEATTQKGEPIAVGVSVGQDGRIQTVTPLHDSADMTGQERMAHAVASAQGRIYARNKKALDEARALAARSPGTIPLQPHKRSNVSVVTRDDVVKSRRDGGTTGSTVTAIRNAIRKTYGNAIDGLERSGMVTLAQSQEAAVNAAAKARAKATGQSVHEAQQELMASVLRSEAPEASNDTIRGELSELSDLARSKGNQNKTVEVARVSDGEARLLQREGVSVDAGFRHTVDMFAVRHTINRHGDAQSEARLGQLPIGDTDISAIPSVLEAPDARLLGAKTPRGQEIVGSLKRMPDGTILYLEEVRSGRKTLAMTSMRKYPGTTDFEAIRNRVVPSYARSDTGDVRIIPQNAPSIKLSADGRIQGFYDPQSGQSFLVADGLTAETAPGVLAHEVGIHWAADTKDPRGKHNMDRLMRRAGVLLRDGKGEFYDRVRQRMEDAGETSDEEAAAYIAEEYERGRAAAPATIKRYIQEFIAAVRGWLNSKGVKLDLTAADIAAIARANVRRAALRRPQQGQGEARRSDASPTEQQVRDLVAQYASDDGAPSEAEMREAVQQFRDTERRLGGPQAYAQAKADGRTNLAYHQWVQVRTPNFKRWWGYDWEQENGRITGPSEFDSESDSGARGRSGRGANAQGTEARDALAAGRQVSPGSSGDGAQRGGQEAGGLVQGRTGEDRARDGGAPAVDIRRDLPFYELTTGEPRVFYHGTRDDFTAFDVNHPNKKDAGWLGRGHYVTSSDWVAAEYASMKRGDGSPRVMPLFVRPSNPRLLVPKDKRIIRRYSADQLTRFNRNTRRMGHDGVMVLFDNGDIEVVTFDANGLKSATANIGTFSERDDIRFSRAADGAVYKSAEGRPDRITLQTPWDSPSSTKFDNMVYTLQDKHVDTKRTLAAIRDAGNAIGDDLDVYLKETLYHGRTAKRTKDFVQRELDPLLVQMRKDGVTMNALEQYLHARHAKEANELIAKRDPKMRDGGSGMMTKDAQAYLSGLSVDARVKLDRAAKLVDKILAQTRQLYVAYGLESQSTVDGWGKMFQHYVPLHREDMAGGSGLGQGFSVAGREVKGRTGSVNRKVVDILANIAMQRERVITRGEKNRVALALYGLAKTNPNPEFWQTDVVPVKRVMGQDGMIHRVADRNYKMRDNVVVVKMPDRLGRVTERAILFNERNDRAVRMALSLKNLDTPKFEGFMGGVQAVTRYLAAVNTQYNPIFGVTNMVRDIGEGALNLSSTPISGKQAAVAKNIVPALAGVMSNLRAERKGQAGAGGKWGALWQDFQSRGGQTGYRDLFRDSSHRATRIQRTLTPEGWMETRAGQIFTAGGILKVPLASMQKRADWAVKLLSDYNEAMENATRLAAYGVGIDSGMTRDQAAAMAKGLTVNFNRKGQSTRLMGSLYAFFNATVQGSTRMGQTLFTMDAGKPKTLRLSKNGKIIIGGGILYGAMQALMLSALGFDDDDIPDFIRERNFIIPTGGGKYVTVPMPLGYHFIPNLGRIAMEHMLGETGKAEAVFDLAGMLADAFNPTGGDTLTAGSITPTPVRSLVEVAENKNFTGRPIAKKRFNEQEPGFKLARDTASLPATWIAQAINWVTGGTEYTRGELDPTPDQIDYLIGQATGGVGRELTKISQTVQAMVTGDDLPTYKIPLVGRFYGDATNDATHRSRFYSNLDDISRHKAQADGLDKDGRYDEATAYEAAHPEIYLARDASRLQRRMSEMRQDRKRMQKEGVARDEIRAMEKELVEDLKRFNEEVKRERATVE